VVFLPVSKAGAYVTYVTEVTQNHIKWLLQRNILTGG